MDEEALNLEKYFRAVRETFGLADDFEINGLRYQSIEEWDSVGHMALMTELEDVFEIEIDIDDIIDFSSIEYGREVLSKYGVSL